MSTPAIRAALERLINAVLDGLAQDDHPMGWARVDDALAAARAALAAAPEAVTEDSSAPPSPTPLMGEPNKLRAALNRIESLVEQANAAFKPLAELLNSPTTPPAPLEGEVGTLAKWLNDQSVHLQKMQEIGALPETELQEMLDLAATLLKQQEYRIANLRSALRECGRAVGSLIQVGCSDSFLLQVPAEVQAAVAALSPDVLVAIPCEQWHEDDGPCLWWRFPIVEPPWVGTPLDRDWHLGYHTHFTRIVCPVLPAPQGGEVDG